MSSAYSVICITGSHKKKKNNSVIQVEGVGASHVDLRPQAVSVLLHGPGVQIARKASRLGP